MTHDDALAALESVKAALHGQFEDAAGTHRARLEQLDASLATAAMAVEHLHDEEVREVELAHRLAQRARVHGNDEVVSPVGRHHEQTLVIAGRA